MKHPPKFARSLIVAALIGPAWHAGTHAQPAATTENATLGFDIPAQPLSAALNALGRQAGVQIAADTALLAGKTAPPVKGNHSVREALRLLLAGSGLEAVVSGGSVLVRSAPAPTIAAEPTLPAIRALASAQSSPTDLPAAYAGGQVARGARLGMLGNTDVMTTPFSIKSYTSELIRDQGARSVDDVVANDPSIRVSLSPGFGLDQSAIRGFPVTVGAYRIYGVPGLFGYSRVPVQNYERVEILKGPGTGVYGAGSGSFSVGGVINLVPKRAGATPTDALTVSAADEAMFATHIDVGRRFGTDNAFGVRLNLVAEKGELSNSTRRTNVTPQLALDFASERFRATLDIGHNDYENRRHGVNHLLAAGQPVPAAPDPRRADQPAFARLAVDGYFGLLGAEFDIARDLTAYAKYGKFHEENDDSIQANIGPLQGDGTFTVSEVANFPFRTDNEVTDVGVRASFSTGPIRHQATVSALRYSNLTSFPIDEPIPPFVPVVGSIYADYPITNPFTGGIPDAGPYSGDRLLQNSIGVADSMTLLDDRLNLVVGLRHQQIEQAAYSGSRNSPTVAASYQLGSGFTVYANYAEALLQGAQAPDDAANAGDNLPPYVGKQNEVGLKWNAGRYTFTLAYFDIKQASAFTDPADNVFKAAGEQRNRGVELETFGELTRGVRVLGGVAYIDAIQTKTLGGATDGRRALGVSEINVNLGSEWDVAALPGLTLTGRVIHTGSAFVDLGNTQELPSWTRLDIGARYAMKLDGKAVTLRAGINNLADRAYWQTGGRNRFVVAEPRTWRLSATVDF